MPKTCSVSGCGRPIRAARLCATHYERKRAGIPNALAAIRHKRAPVGTVRLSGVRVSVECAEKLKAEADDRRVTVHAVAVDVLERWARRR